MIDRVKAAIKKMTHRASSDISCKIIPEVVRKALEGHHVFLGREVSVYKESVAIGDYTYINGGKLFYAKIGKFCSIGYNVIIGGGYALYR